MSKPNVQPYIFFGGHCKEALDFYRTALGAQVDMLMTYKESPEPPPPGQLPPGYENKIMHASFRIGDTPLMGSDGCGEDPGFKGFTLALNVATEAEADRYFNALADGGKINMPLSKTFWSPKFGMVEDRFGMDWMVSVMTDAPKAA